MSHNQLEEQQERESIAWIASELGIAPDELAGQEYEVDETGGNDGAVYGHTVTFREGSNPEVLAKIDGGP